MHGSETDLARVHKVTLKPGARIMRVWGDETPAGARETLHSYVMRLRRTLGQAGGTPVVTCPDGYLIKPVSPRKMATLLESMFDLQ